MAQTCIICGNEYEETICPYCGYAKDRAGEPQYLESGVQLGNGRYVISCAVGAGGFGITYSAWDTLLKQRVAIKEYLPGEFSTRVKGVFDVTVYGGEKSEQFKDGLDKFLEESRKLAKFGHVPGIVQIFDYFQENNTAYIVMEYLDGETLGERLDREKKIPVDEALSIVTTILEALEVVHKEGIIHRDIAPNNIFLCKDGKVKLLDFGAARSATGTHSKSLTVLFKKGFTPEEQYSSRGDQGPWTDVYATAATMYAAITGEVPEGAMERLVKDNLKEPSKKGVKIPDPVENALMNALNVDHRMRTQTAQQFNEQLHSPNVKRTFKRTKTKRVGRVPRAVWVIAGVLLTIIAVFFVLLRTEVIDFYRTPFANLFVGSGKARVLNLINMEQEEAVTRLEKVGLDLEVSEVIYSNDVAEGRIISQSIEKGQIVDEGTVIEVVVSKGAETVAVPELIDYKWEDKISELEELHLKYEVVEEESIFAPGYVVSSSPAPGDPIEQGQTVTVHVSTGMTGINGEETTIDNLIEMSVDDARALLAEKKIYLVVEARDFDDNVPKNLIMKQSIQEGETASAGDTVYVTMSEGIEQKEVPELTGMMEADATKALEDLSLTPLTKITVNKEVEEGLVLSQSIPAASVVDKYTEVEIEIASHGYEIPRLTGMSQAEAERVCRENGFDCNVEEVFGGSGQVKTQSPEEGEIVEEQGSITIQVGISESEFTQNLMAEINSRRRASGMGALSLNSSWSAAAQDLANSGHESVEFQNSGYDYTWAYRQRGLSPGYMSFWATRNNMTTVADAVSRLPMSSQALMDPSKRIVGVAYHGTRICMLIVD